MTLLWLTILVTCGFCAGVIVTREFAEKNCKVCDFLLAENEFLRGEIYRLTNEIGDKTMN